MTRKGIAKPRTTRASRMRIRSKDPNVPVIQEALAEVSDKLRFPRGRIYRLRRGRGRVIVEPL